MSSRTYNILKVISLILIIFLGIYFSGGKFRKLEDKINNIIETSKTVLWNGPAGYFENPNFALGSYEIAKMIIKKNKDNSIFSVAGGGDTIAFLNQINALDDFNFASTAGGAFLEYLEGKELPGIKALN